MSALADVKVIILNDSKQETCQQVINDKMADY